MLSTRSRVPNHNGAMAPITVTQFICFSNRPRFIDIPMTFVFVIGFHLDLIIKANKVIRTHAYNPEHVSSGFSKFAGLG